jgi:hypothetical protein
LHEIQPARVELSRDSLRAVSVTIAGLVARREINDEAAFFKSHLE